MDNRTVYIAICDDDVNECEKTYNLCKDYVEKYKIDCNIKIFSGGDELLMESLNYDILILDVEMPHRDGFDIARELIGRGQNTYIIYITAYEKRFSEAFKVKAFRYLVKPYDKKELYEALNSAFKEIADEKIMILEDKGKSFVVSIEKDIYHIESLGEGICIHLKNNKKVNSKATLRDLNKNLTDSFFRCHKAHIINLMMLEEYNKEGKNLEAVLSDGEKIPISARNHAKIREAQKNLVKNRAKPL